MRSLILPLLTNLIWVVGYMLTGLIVLYVPNWRHMLLWANVPFVLGIVYIWYASQPMAIDAERPDTQGGARVAALARCRAQN